MPLLRKLKPDQVAKIVRPARWRGMAPDIDPQNLAEDQFFLKINTRDVGGFPLVRGGQTLRVNVGGRVTGLATHEIGAARSLFITGDGCPEVSAGAGSYLGVIDQELADPDSQLPSSYRNATYYSTATRQIVAATFGDELFFGLDAVLKRFSAADSLQETRLAFPSAYVGVSAMIEHQGVLLLALVGAAASGVGTSAIFTFDGVTLQNELAAINVVKGFGLYNELAAAIFDGTPNSIRVRSAIGVWGAPIAPGAGTVKIVGSNCSSYRNKLWIPNADEDLFALDETMTLTRFPVGTTGVDAGAHIMGTAVMSDENNVQMLYFLWHNTAETDVYIGRFDGTTWTPKLKNLTAQASYPGFQNQFPGNTYPTLFVPGISRCLRQYRGSLVAAAIEPPAGIAAAYFSPRGDIDGTWTRLLMSVSQPNSDINDMVVF